LDLAAKGSSQIGGNISTNAGGLKLIRYGGMREQVLGIEVVLADGTILDMNTAIRKNNTGYDLKQLFISAEGTLGIITRATLRLMPKPKDLQLLCMGIPHITEIPMVLKRINKLGIQPTACEFFSQKALDLVLRYHTELKAPLSERVDYYVLLEIENHGRAEEQFSELCELLFEDGTVTDAVVSQSSQQFREIWALRENISESISMYGHVRKNDISVPIDMLSSFVERVDEVINSEKIDIDLILFGHIGDGNIHINYVAPPAMDATQFKTQAAATERKIFNLLPEFKGSISAEHGIGLIKKHDLKLSRSELEIGIMKAIRQLLDAKGIMNPGKIF
jgi:FAD/FMN-containing dehydrogenase